MDPILLALLNKPKPAARPAASRPVAGPPAAPDFTSLIQALARGPAQRDEAELNRLLDARVKPFTDAIDRSVLNARAQNEYALETKSAARTGLSSAMLGILTGGKTGAEAEAFSKENFGGSYLGAQAMSLAADAIRELTNDFDERDWQIQGEYLQAMQQVPGIREDLRKQIESADLDEYERKFKTATLLMDETWRAYQQKYGAWSDSQKLAEEKRQFDSQMQLAAGELGVKLTNAKSTAVRAATGAKNANTSAKNAALSAARLAFEKAKEKRQAAKSKAEIRQADANIKLRREELRLQQAKAKKGGSEAQKAETDLALSILKDADVILGKPGEYPDDPRVGVMPYQEAYDYVYGLADALMGSYRGSAYINSWVKKRLAALGLRAPQKRSGR